MGTPSYAIPVLRSLLDSSHDVIAVYCKPDAASGRGKRQQAHPLAEYAEECRLPVFRPFSLTSGSVAQEILGHAPDVIVVAAYGLILPDNILNLPAFGCLNVHPSLLPKYRGASPVSSAILNGDDETGVTIIQLDNGVDTGPILANKVVKVESIHDAINLTEKLFQEGADILVEVLSKIDIGLIDVSPQTEVGASITKKLVKEDGEINWDLGAARIERQIRACRPWPGTFTYWKGKLIKIIEGSVVDSKAKLSCPAGTVVSFTDNRYVISTGDGAIGINMIQLEGRSVMSASNFALGHKDFTGSQLGL